MEGHAVRVRVLQFGSVCQIYTVFICRTIFSAFAQDKPWNPGVRKHFGLVQYQPQANHFVVFDKYWSSQRRPSGTSNLSHLFQPLDPRPMLRLPAPAPYRGINADCGRRAWSQPLAQRRQAERAAFQRAGSAITSNSSLSLVAAMAQGRLWGFFWGMDSNESNAPHKANWLLEVKEN